MRAAAMEQAVHAENTENVFRREMINTAVYAGPAIQAPIVK